MRHIQASVLQALNLLLSRYWHIVSQKAQFDCSLLDTDGSLDTLGEPVHAWRSWQMNFQAPIGRPNVQLLRSSFFAVGQFIVYLTQIGFGRFELRFSVIHRPEGWNVVGVHPNFVLVFH